jgi:hypothetical protein
VSVIEKKTRSAAAEEGWTNKTIMQVFDQKLPLVTCTYLSMYITLVPTSSYSYNYFNYGPIILELFHCAIIPNLKSGRA